MPPSGKERSKRRETCWSDLVVVGLGDRFNIREWQKGEDLEKKFLWECGKGRHGCGGSGRGRGDMENL
jgi:hypothetical protein